MDNVFLSICFSVRACVCVCVRVCEYLCTCCLCWMTLGINSLPVQRDDSWQHVPVWICFLSSVVQQLSLLKQCLYGTLYMVTVSNYFPEAGLTNGIILWLILYVEKWRRSELLFEKRKNLIHFVNLLGFGGNFPHRKSLNKKLTHSWVKFLSITCIMRLIILEEFFF